MIIYFINALILILFYTIKILVTEDVIPTCVSWKKQSTADLNSYHNFLN
jgi:hypothetical protein